MIEKYDFQMYDVSCDFCSFVETFEDVFNWMDLIERMKSCGWTIIYKEGEYEHVCSECKRSGKIS